MEIPKTLFKFAVVLAFLLGGCATTDPTALQDPTKATITGHWERYGPTSWDRFRLISIDGNAVWSSPFQEDYAMVTLVLAGSRVITVRAMLNRNWERPVEADIKFRAEVLPSAKYQINGKLNGNRIEAWLEDAATHEKISEVRDAPFQPMAKPGIFIPVPGSTKH